MTTKPRVLLADDHAILLAGISELIASPYEVVGAVEDGRALLEAAERFKPDLIIMDIAMPLLNGLDAARQLRKLVPNSKLLFLTMHVNPRYVVAAFKAGASGYLIKQSAAAQLIQGIEIILKGHYYISPELTKPIILQAIRAEEPPITRGIDELTQRQREVLQLIGEGQGTKDIAITLRLSVKTVEFHKACLMNTLGLHTTAELTRYAITQGLAYTDDDFQADDPAR